MNRYMPLLILLSTTLLLTSCDALGLKSKITKCDDPTALELTANLIRLNLGYIANHSLATTEMILNQGVDKEVGKTSCVASFVFTSPSKKPTTDTCKYVSRTGYELQNDTTGQLVSTITEVGPSSCVKFTTGEIVEWFQKAARQGNADAQFNLGYMYATSDGVAKNDAEAVKWWRLAADQGNVGAQYNLGVMYAKGEGVAESAVEAVKWFRLAADQGNADAQSNLGWKYANGLGVAKNDAEAVKWYRFAAEQGNADAQFNLGVKYATGSGVAESKVDAYFWYNLAAAQGLADAKTNNEIIEKEMTREQIAEAQRRSAAWKPKK